MAAKERLFIDACKKKFKEDPTSIETKFYCYGGWKQSKRKVEFVEAANKIAKQHTHDEPGHRSSARTEVLDALPALTHRYLRRAG